MNLSVEYIFMSMPILSHKDNYCTFVLSSNVFIGGGGSDIYVYI